MLQNVFTESYNTPFNTVPFNRIRLEDYEPAMIEGMRQENEAIEKIINNPEPPTFRNTIAPETGQLLDRVTTIFFNLLSADTSDEMDALAQKMSPILTQHAQSIMLNERLWARVKAVYEHHEPLDAEEQTLLHKVYDGFVRNGANLSPKDKETLQRLSIELSQLTLQFSQNHLKDQNDYILHITEEKELSGLPQSALEASAMNARERGMDGWVFTLQGPSYTPFMTYADNRELRRQMHMAYATMCTHDNEWNNLQIVPRIVNLRRQIAQILGFPTYAHYVLQHRMAGDTAHVYNLLNDLLDAYLPVARQEIKDITLLAQEMEGEDFVLQPWDFAYYSHKLKKQRYDIDAEMLRPYFELSRVCDGVFGLATRLYGITFHPRKDIPVYHPEVEAWEVRDRDGSYLAVLYTDFHPRKSKQSGAWMTSYKEQWMDSTEGNSRPHVSVTMNLTKPTETKPALLTLGEVETFLHEFGHALHGIFSQVRFRSLNGTNVYWDFVELPSQFMENYAIEPEFLSTFARHYETGEPLPQELIQRIRASRNFNCGYACVRQVSFSLLDMAYYTRTADLDEDIIAFEHKAWERAQIFPQIPEACMSTQFGHIMSGGYAAGYYSYKWAEVLDADAFGYFQQKGIFDQATAQSFRDNVLSKGATEPPMNLYVRFRGQEPTIDALLHRNGIENRITSNN